MRCLKVRDNSFRIVTGIWLWVWRFIYRVYFLSTKSPLTTTFPFWTGTTRMTFRMAIVRFFVTVKTVIWLVTTTIKTITFATRLSMRTNMRLNLRFDHFRLLFDLQLIYATSMLCLQLNGIACSSFHSNSSLYCVIEGEIGLGQQLFLNLFTSQSAN